MEVPLACLAQDAYLAVGLPLLAVDRPCQAGVLPFHEVVGQSYPEEGQSYLVEDLLAYSSFLEVVLTSAIHPSSSIAVQAVVLEPSGPA